MGMKAKSGLFNGTSGTILKLNEDIFYSISNDNQVYIDVKNLPGRKGIKLKKRLSQCQMEYLTKKYCVEFALIYILGPKKKWKRWYILFVFWQRKFS